MTPVNADMTINEVVRNYPATMKVFNLHKVDSCCGGAQSLRAAAELNGVPLDLLLGDLNAAAGGK